MTCSAAGHTILFLIVSFCWLQAASADQIYSDSKTLKSLDRDTRDDTLYEIPEEVPEPVKDIEPEFPFSLRSKGIKGTVVVLALITEDGSVEQAEVVEGPTELFEYALRAVRESSFKPARQGGTPVKCWVHVPVEFTEWRRVPEVRDGEVSFIRNDKVLEWRTTNTGKMNLSDRYRINLESNMSSALNMATGSGLKDRWYDTVFNEAEIGCRVSDRMEIGVTAREDWNRDTLSKFGNSLLTTSLDSKMVYKPFSGLDINAGAGQLYDRRFDNEDQGAGVNGRVKYEAQPLNHVYTTLNVSGLTSTLKRSNDQTFLQGEVMYENPFGRMAVGLEDKRSVRGYFSDVDRKGIEDRERIERNVRLLFSHGDRYKNRAATAIDLFMNFGDKEINDTANNNMKSTKYRNNSKGSVKDMSFQASRGFFGRYFVGAGGGYIRDKNDVERSDRSRTQTDVAANCEIGVGFGQSDSLSINSWIKRTRIDTPEGIPNDRDELKFESGVKYTRQLSVNCKTGLDFRILETHYVNIDASQSSQNKWMKTYQLSPVFVYSPTRAVRFDHRVNLYVSYIDYDYDSDANPRSNLTRRITSETWMIADLSNRTRVTAGLMFEGNDYGNLDSRNRKLPLEEGIRRFTDFTIDYKFAGWMTLSPVYVYSIREDNNINRNVVILREEDQTYGLKGKLFKSNRDDYAVIVSIKRIVRRTNIYPLRIRDYITLIMRYEF